jgi:hypothetical protein
VRFLLGLFIKKKKIRSNLCNAGNIIFIANTGTNLHLKYYAHSCLKNAWSGLTMSHVTW